MTPQQRKDWAHITVFVGLMVVIWWAALQVRPYLPEHEPWRVLATAGMGVLVLAAVAAFYIYLERVVTWCRRRSGSPDPQDP